MKRSIWVGFDRREATAFAVTFQSVIRQLSQPIPVDGVILSELEASGLYTRPREVRADGQLAVMYDVISDAPMSTEHANARFLTPHLAETGWALFMDGDMLARADLAPVFDGLDPAKAVYCVQHQHDVELSVKMDGQIQTPYARKNWSSFMIFNCDHPANQALTLELVNTAPGRDLHRFCWLEDELIGALPAEWNHLIGVTPADTDPKVVHFTLGTPDMKGWEDQPYADEWRAEQRRRRAA